MSRDERLGGATVRVDTLVSQLAQAVGEEKAWDVVVDAAGALGFGDQEMSRGQALEVLGAIAETPGIVGVCARFARTRMMLAGTAIATTREP